MKFQFGTTLRGRVRLANYDCKTKKLVKRSHWKNNLVLDTCLNAFPGFATIMTSCKVGSGTNPNSYASGGITFTQSGTTITASGGFFTSAMVGGIFKYGASGSAGAEYYITAFTDSTHITVDTSATVSTPTAATVWQVQQTGLQTWLGTSVSYNSGANPVYASPTLTLTRVCVFNAPASTWNVNEVGYSKNTNSDGTCQGRIALGSTWVVPTTQFLVVTVQIVYTLSPAVPTSVPNVCTGYNWAGNIMYNWWDCQIVNLDGSAGTTGSGGNLMDVSTNVYTVFFGAGSVPVNSTIQNGTPPYDSPTTGSAVFSHSGQPTGVYVATISINQTYSGGTWQGLSLGGAGGGSNPVPRIFLLLFTTAQTFPTGSLIGTMTIVRTFSRTLSN